MGSSYGLIEVSGVVAAIDSLDAMTKAASVELVTWERKLGGRLVTIIVEGEISDVKAAVDAADNICKVNNHILAASGVIASPCEETRKMVALSASRLKRQKEAEQAAKADKPAETKTEAKPEKTSAVKTPRTTRRTTAKKNVTETDKE